MFELAGFSAGSGNGRPAKLTPIERAGAADWPRESWACPPDALGRAVTQPGSEGVVICESTAPSTNKRGYTEGNEDTPP